MRSADAEVLGVQLSWAAVSDRGLVRARNEDSVLAEAGLYVVADGMGGHSAGDVASGITVDEVRMAAAAGPAGQGTAIPQAIQDANRRIRALAGERVIGSTVTGLVLSEFGEEPAWLVWNVGDSRCYRVESGEIEQITTDHTLVAEMVESGELRKDEVSQHPDRHVITRAVGADEVVQADFWLLRPTAGQRFVLCSDGLTNELADDEIRSVVADADSAAGAAISLLSAALENGGHDNVSAVVVFCNEVTSRPRSQTTDLDVTAPRVAILDRIEGSDVNPSTDDPPPPTLISEVPK